MQALHNFAFQSLADNPINRRPQQEELSEATDTVHVVCLRARQPEVREKLVELLETASYPVRDVDQHAFGQSDAEIEATLYATAVEPEELDRVMVQLEAQAGVLQAFWSASSEDRGHRRARGAADMEGLEVDHDHGRRRLRVTE